MQLHGEKRILLAPPSAAHDMMLFPSIHPSYHQSQHRPSEYGPLLARGLDGDDQEAPSLTAFARAKRSMLAVVVRPGDVLYIPRMSPGRFSGETLLVEVTVDGERVPLCGDVRSFLVPHCDCAEPVVITERYQPIRGGNDLLKGETMPTLSIATTLVTSDTFTPHQAFWTKVPLGKLTSPRDKRIGVQLFIAGM